MRTNRFAGGIGDIGITDRGAAFDALHRGIRTIAAMLRMWRRRRRDRRELARLDDRTLRDIGLTRADAEFLINKPFWRE